MPLQTLKIKLTDLCLERLQLDRSMQKKLQAGQNLHGVLQSHKITFVFVPQQLGLLSQLFFRK